MIGGISACNIFYNSRATSAIIKFPNRITKGCGMALPAWKTKLGDTTSFPVCYNPNFLLLRLHSRVRKRQFETIWDHEENRNICEKQICCYIECEATRTTRSNVATRNFIDFSAVKNTSYQCMHPITKQLINLNFSHRKYILTC